MESTASVPKIGPSTSVPKFAPSTSAPLFLPSTSSRRSLLAYKSKYPAASTGSSYTFQLRAKEALKSKIETAGHGEGDSYVFCSATVENRYDEVSHFLSTIAIKKVDFNREVVAEAESKYEVGSKFKMSLYQRYFIGSGISLSCDAYSSTKGEGENIEICVNLEAHEFISHIKAMFFVIYPCPRKLT
ncbi:hypothetical protein BDD12DRAFT_885557 [Trichophaea hybrida]|nr:hypothetical protein BDD12DRAFT_885557 [Trichophaea hybrida]